MKRTECMDIPIVKKIMLFLVMFGGFSCGTTETTNPMFTYETIIQVHHLTKAQIISKSKQWITTNFRSDKKVVDYEDGDAGLLAGKAIIKVPIAGEDMHDMNFNFTLIAKEGRFKITYSGFMWADGSDPSHLHQEETKNYYITKFGEFNAALKLSLINSGALD